MSDINPTHDGMCTVLCPIHPVTTKRLSLACREADRGCCLPLMARLIELARADEVRDRACEELNGTLELNPGGWPDAYAAYDMALARLEKCRAAIPEPVKREV